MSALTSNQNYFDRIKKMVRPQSQQAPEREKHAPRPLQQTTTKTNSNPSGLNLQRRRVTLSRTARKWSRGIVWSLLGLTGFSLAYGMIARIETSIEASGTLEPTRGTASVSAPFPSLVEKVLVKNGEKVNANQPLLVLQDEASSKHIESLGRNKDQVLRDLAITRDRLDLPPLNSQDLDADAQREVAIANKETQLRKRINSHEASKAHLAEQGELAIMANLSERAEISEKTMQRLITLQRQGAVSSLQVDQERQRLLDTRMQLQKQRTLIAQTPFQSASTQLRIEHVTIQEQRNLYDKLAKLNHQLAEIDRQVAEQQKRSSLLTIRAPRSGVVFDLAAGKGELASPNNQILEIVPTDNLKAKVMIPNKDIGFVEEGMPVEVRIASYPFTEYGSIKGTLKQIGANSKSTNPNIPTEHFPATIELEGSSLSKNGEKLPLKSGMSVSGLIKLGSRPAISLVSDRIVSLFDGVRYVR